MGPDLTPRMAVENDWHVYGDCRRCRELKTINVKALYRRAPDRDLGEALARGKLKCTRCKEPCVGISVSKLDCGIIKPVMKMTPGLTVTRESSEE